MRHIVWIGVLALIGSPAVAQQKSRDTNVLISELANCQRIQDAMARLACLDRASSALVGAVAQGHITVLEREQVRSARRSLFGFTVPDLPFLGGRDKDGVEPPKELTSSLVSFRPIGFNRYRFTISDGNAVWETTEGAMLTTPAKGTVVVIRRGAFGGHFARVGKAKWVQARRIR